MRDTSKEISALGGLIQRFSRENTSLYQVLNGMLSVIPNLVKELTSSELERVIGRAKVNVIYSDRVEVTNAAGVMTQVKNIVGLTIPSTSAMRLTFAIRRSSTGSTNTGFILRIGLNGTQVTPDMATHNANNAETQSGIVEVLVAARTTSYDRSLIGRLTSYGASGQGTANNVFGPGGGAIPVGAINSIQISVNTGSVNITAGVAGIIVEEIKG